MLRKRGEARPNQSAPQCSFWQQLSFARAYRLWPLPSYGNDGDDDVMQLGGDDDECTSRLSMFILATAWNEAKVLRIVFDAWLFCSQRRLLRPTNPYVVFAAGQNIKTHQDSHGILKRNHSEPFRVIKVEMSKKHRITMRTKRNSPFRTIQNHSSHQAILVVRCVVVIRETGQQVCVIVCGLVCRNAATLPVAAVACACSRFGFRVSVAKFPLRT